MYVIQRNSSFWLCTTILEAFECKAVSLRLQGKVKKFDEFEQQLSNGEIINAGVIKIYKCADVTTCKDCEKYTKCEIRLKAIETITAHNEWVKLVESNGGYTF